ncbi:MAG: hypothetical protein WCI11_04340 [Candidatus Methylumidiphilus sp.]
MPESSHKDVNLGVGHLPKSSTCASGKLPSMALDSGIHAGMTAFLARWDLCITMRSGAWERAEHQITLVPPASINQCASIDL